MDRIAITGANGMAGRHMCALLKEKNIPYLALSRKEWDVRDWKKFDQLDSVFGSSAAVFHFAAQLPNNDSSTVDIFDANVRSCLNLAEWALSRAVPLVFLSGATVYKDAHGKNITESDEKVVNGFGGFYGYSKLLAENIFEHFRNDGLKIVILRPSSIYGYGLSNEKLIPSFIASASRGETILISQPENRVNLIHAYDVARAALTAYESNSWGVFNIGAESHSIIDIAEMAIKISGKGEVSLTDTDYDHKPFNRFDLDSSLAKASFDFQPVISLQEGMELISLCKENS